MKGPPPAPTAAEQAQPVALNIIRKWPEGFAARLQHVWLDVVSFTPNVKLWDLQRMLAEFGFTMTITENAASPQPASPAPAQAPAVPAELQAQVPWLIAPEDLEPEPSSAVKASDLADQLRTFRAKRFLDWNMQENQLVVDAFHALKSEPSAPADQLRKWASEAVKLLGPEDHEVRDNLRAALAAASQPPATKGVE